MTLPIKADLAFLTASPSHQEACTNLLSSSVSGQTEWKPQSQKTNQNDHMDHSFVELNETCMVTQDGWGHGGEFWQNMVHWRREWQTTSAFLSWEPHEQYEKEKRYDMERWKPRMVGDQYTTGEEQRNSSSRNEEAEPKQKWHPVVDVTGGESKVQCCKEQYCIGTWNVRTMNQGKLEVVKQEMARVNIDILGISELTWTGMGKFNSDDHYIYYCRQKSLKSKGVTLSQQKSLKCSSWVQSQKQQNDLSSFPRQTIQYLSNPSLCPNH